MIKVSISNKMKYISSIFANLPPHCLFRSHVGRLDSLIGLGRRCCRFLGVFGNTESNLANYRHTVQSTPSFSSVQVTLPISHSSVEEEGLDRQLRTASCSIYSKINEKSTDMIYICMSISGEHFI